MKSLILSLLVFALASACGDQQATSQLNVRVGDEGKVVVADPDQVIVKGFVDMMAFVNVYISKFKADEFNIREMFFPASGKFVDIKDKSNIRTVIDQIKAVKVGTSLDLTLEWKDKDGGENYMALTIHRIAGKKTGEPEELHMVMRELFLHRPGWASNIYVTEAPFDPNGKRQDYGPTKIWVGAMITPMGEYTDFFKPDVFPKAIYFVNRMMAQHETTVAEVPKPEKSEDK